MEDGHILNCDILIIGGGVSGIISAILASRKGYNITLILGNKKIENDIIESIHPGLLSLLNSLNISLDVSKLSVGTYTSISNGESINRLNQDEVWTAHHISKLILIDQLIDNLSKTDTLVVNEKAIRLLNKDGKPFLIETTNEKITFKYVLDCSGSSRFLTKKMKLCEKKYSSHLVASRGVAYNLKKNFTKEANAFFIPYRNGWLWIARLQNGSYYWTEVLEKQNFKNKIPELFAKSIHNKISGSSNVSWRITRPLCSEKFIICGDAGSVIDPASGQGNLQAVLSSIQAIETVDRCLKNPTLESLALTMYNDFKTQEFDKKAKELIDYYKNLNINF
ncbi:tryptophan 7-halogenase [Tenacibaculum maritimum]|uniref:NAD(P)/FAD-dependent oxidoreductase n=1 Tax=Tenacibaculum maritimum TaxID=107401 RepID=UPI0038905757